MEQLTLVQPGTIAWRDVPEPRLEGPGEALVRPLAVSRCDIDLPLVTGLLPPPHPFALGHECVGEIVALGDGVGGLQQGQRVIVPFQISCGRCARCARGHTGSCETVPFLSAFGLPLSGREWGGALSGLVRVPFAEAMLVPAPDGVPAWWLAAVADNASDGWRCVAPHLRERPGAPVLVVGGLAPSIALYAADAALALGAERVDVVSPNPALLGVAERIGAHAIEAGFDGMRGPYPITVDASADPAGLHLAIRSTDLEGVCVSPVYYPADGTRVPLGQMYTRGIRFHTGRCHARGVIPEVADVIACGRLHPEMIATRRVAWDEAAHAMAEPEVKLVVDREPA
jgi:threonine dehydrogenase-like Zn-dependent dehydrogenase